MDGVSSAFAVVSLAIQLVETGEKINKFLTSIQDAPSEIIKLGQTLDQLNSVLKQVSYLLEQQYLVLRLPGSPVFITNALENCEKRIKTLEDVIQKAKKSMDHRGRVQRSWATMRFVSKKEDIQEMQSQLRDAQAGLQTAMLSNSWQLQMHQISISSSNGLQAMTIEEPALAAPIESVSQKERVQSLSPTGEYSFRNTAKESNLVWYRGFFGTVKIQFRSNSPTPSNTRRHEIKATNKEKIITITPILLRKTLELRLQNSFGRISRTLSTYPVLEDRAPIFEICREGDLQGLQVALSSGSVSPFVLDEDGWSLLHYAAMYTRPEICALLLQLGVDPNRVTSVGGKAMPGAIWDKPSEPGDFVDTLRLLTRSQTDLSPTDMVVLWGIYVGPVEGAEFMFSQGLLLSEFYNSDDDDDYFPPLATALRAYSTEPSRWDSFIRLLLRKRPGLHMPVPRNPGFEVNERNRDLRYPCKILQYGTPLDELFAKTETPFEGEAAAKGWLQILSSEGYDVGSYLEEEQALHAAQKQLTCPDWDWLYYYVPRQLIYNWGSNPSVSWDWWIDPESSTYLVLEEFKHMDLLRRVRDSSSSWYPWEFHWPMGYPTWEIDFFTHGYKSIDYKRAQERANRRMKKKSMKAARAQGFKRQDRMPGAWHV